MKKNKGKKRPRDINELAASILEDATDPKPEAPDGKNPHAVALGRLGGTRNQLN